MRRGLAAIAAALALVMPVQAEAACAWVLWGQASSLAGGFMSHPMDAFKTREECHAEKASREARMKAEIKEGRALGVVLFSCLPDTIDPRGPKGGK